MYSYQHHIRDFNSATMHLTRIQRSIYLDLIHLYYEIEGQLPLDFDYLCRKIRATGDQQVLNDVELCLNEFFTKTQYGYFHATCELVIHEYHSNTTKKSVAGKASAEAKKRKKQELLDKAKGIESSIHADSSIKTVGDANNSTGVQQVLNSVETVVQQNSTNCKPETINHKQLTVVSCCEIPKDYKLPESLIIETIKLWSVNNRPDLDIDNEFSRFTAYNRSKGSRSACWDSMWSLWALNSIKDTHNRIEPVTTQIKSYNDDFLKRHTDRQWANGLKTQ